MEHDPNENRNTEEQQNNLGSLDSARIAYHGLHQAILAKRLERSQQAYEDSSFDPGFIENLGHRAVESSQNIDQNGNSLNMPPPKQPVRALSAQANAYAYMDEALKRSKTPLANDPPTEPMTRIRAENIERSPLERELELKLAQESYALSDLRKTQAGARNAFGASGQSSHFKVVAKRADAKMRRKQSVIDMNDYENGSISAEELIVRQKQYKAIRKTSNARVVRNEVAETVDTPRIMIRREKKLDKLSDKLSDHGRSIVAEAEQRQADEEEKQAELAVKLAERQQKIDDIRAKAQAS